MKLSSKILKQLIVESLSEVERMDPREDPEGVYGVDPGGEMSDEAEEQYEGAMIEKLERMISDLTGIVNELRKAQESEKY